MGINFAEIIKKKGVQEQSLPAVWYLHQKTTLVNDKSAEKHLNECPSSLAYLGYDEQTKTTMNKPRIR